MKITRRFLLLTLSFAAPCGAVGGAWAQQVPRDRAAPPQEPRSGTEPQRDVMPQRNPSSLSDSVRRAQRETGGQILGAERVQYDGREINRVKVMDDRGRVRYMDDDPQRSRDGTERRRNLSPRDEAPRPRGERPARP